MHQPIGVCSWSLRPKDPRELSVALGRLGVGTHGDSQRGSAGISGVQLALDPMLFGGWSVDETRRALDGAGARVFSGMMGMQGEDYATLDTIRATGGVRPTRHWERNLKHARDAAQLAERLGIELVTFHGGFVPDDPADPERAVIVERLTAIAAAFEERGLRVALETGQEWADTVIDVLAEIGHTNVGVNFDPANMILYGRDDPIEALEKLASHVFQIHIKDARRSDVPGQWGTETPAGEGEVPWPRFFDALRARELDVALLIEREGGEERIEDVLRAARLVERELARIGRHP
jgi:sugar phosphate isomerase/epimerase